MNRAAPAQCGIGTAVTTVDGLAARLAGGFLAGIDGDLLHDAVLFALSEIPSGDLGDLGPISTLPGFASALCATLAKSWAAGLDLSARAVAGKSERLAVLARLEAAALARLPTASRRPADLVRLALDRLRYAPNTCGALEFRSVPDLDPCWRSLVTALASVVPVCWNAGPRPLPPWVSASDLTVNRFGSGMSKPNGAFAWAKSQFGRLVAVPSVTGW